MKDGTYVVHVAANQVQGTPVPYNPDMPVAAPHGIAFWITLGIVAIIILTAISKSFVMTRENTAKVIQRMGKHNKVTNAGLTIKVPFVDSVYKTFWLSIAQLKLDIETKTSDNVFVNIVTMIQYKVLPDKVKEVAYTLDDVKGQISAYVFDLVRAEVPTMKLDDVFSSKEAIAQKVTKDISEKMAPYGISIVSALIVDISPDEKVKEAMNSINAAQREKVAAESKAEADKIIAVKKAEGDMESKKLQGEGIAAQRKAIAAGMKEAMAMLKESGVKPEEVGVMLLITQYFDTMKDLGEKNAKVIFMPSTPNGMTNIRDQITEAIMSANEAK